MQVQRAIPAQTPNPLQRAMGDTTPIYESVPCTIRNPVKRSEPRREIHPKKQSEPRKSSHPARLSEPPCGSHPRGTKRAKNGQTPHAAIASQDVPDTHATPAGPGDPVINTVVARQCSTGASHRNPVNHSTPASHNRRVSPKACLASQSSTVIQALRARQRTTDTPPAAACQANPRPHMRPARP